jgi:hypothetical protein
MPTVSKQNEAALAEKLAAGAQKHLSGMPQLILESGTLTPAQVQTQLQGFANLRSRVTGAQAAVQAALADEKSKAPAMRAFFNAFIGFVRAAFGNSPDVLADFGLAPKKARKTPTAEQKAAAVAKRKSTREARGTKGKKQKLAIKGDVTGVVVTPVTASTPQPPPSAPTPPAASPPITGAPSH